MSVAALMNQVCTITSRATGATVDRYGNPAVTETTSATTCYAEQTRRTEDTTNTDQQAQDWLVVLPAGTAVDGHDVITIGSLVLEVVGPPWPARNPRTQSVSHIEVSARMVQ